MTLKPPSLVDSDVTLRASGSEERMSVHVLHVVESFGAGTFSILCQMANRQARDGHRVSLAYSVREETPSDWRAQLDARVEPHYLPMRRELAPWADLKSLVGLARLVSRLQPEIVHLHSSKAGALGRLVSVSNRRARWYFSPHGLSFLQGRTPGQIHPVYLALELILARLPTSIVACSVSEAALVERYLRRPALLVPNGIELDAIRSRELRAPAPSLTVGTAGRISPGKHPEFFARVAERLSGCGLRFLWLGGGEPDAEEKLRRAGVEVSGWLPHSKLLTLLPGLDIYLQTSLWEGMPVAVIEAMATGLPVVATDVVGNRDLVQHRLNGWLAASEEEFIDGVQQLASDAALRLSLGHAAREYVLHRHSSHSMMQRLYQAYGV